MGLDTLLRKKVWNEDDDNKENDVCYWRKCYGIDNWLAEHASEVLEPQATWKIETKILEGSLSVFEKYINRLIKQANKLGYEIEDFDELHSLILSLNEEDNDMLELEKVIKPFDYEGLDYRTFEDSIWSPLSTFCNTYQQFKKAIQYPTLILISSY